MIDNKKLVKKLKKLRNRYLKKGGTLLDKDEILEEVRSRRGGSNRESKD